MKSVVSCNDEGIKVFHLWFGKLYDKRFEGAGAVATLSQALQEIIGCYDQREVRHREETQRGF
jgi:hypothetical protein